MIALKGQRHLEATFLTIRAHLRGELRRRPRGERVDGFTESRLGLPPPRGRAPGHQDKHVVAADLDRARAYPSCDLAHRRRQRHESKLEDLVAVAAPLGPLELDLGR